MKIPSIEWATVHHILSYTKKAQLNALSEQSHKTTSLVNTHSIYNILLRQHSK